MYARVRRVSPERKKNQYNARAYDLSGRGGRGSRDVGGRTINIFGLPRVARARGIRRTHIHTQRHPPFTPPPPSPLLGGRGHKGCLSPVLIMSRRVNHREAARRTADVSPGESLTRYAPVRSRPFDSRTVRTSTKTAYRVADFTVSLESICHRKRPANRTGDMCTEVPRENEFLECWSDLLWPSFSSIVDR